MQFTWNDWGVQGSLDLLPLWQLKIPIPGLRYFQPDTVSTPDYLNCLQSKVNHRYKQWRHVQGTVFQHDGCCFNMMDVGSAVLLVYVLWVRTRQEVTRSA